MDKKKAAVLLSVDRTQKEMLKAAGRDRVEWQFIDPQMSREERLPFLKEAEIIFGEPGIRELKSCARLKWVQMSWAGTDVYTMREGFPDGVMLTNARGCFQTVIAEYILGVLLSMGRNLRQYALLQQEECWHQIRKETLLYDRQVLILGAGDIGTGAAKRLKAFGAHVTGMRRTDRNYPDCFDAMITGEELDDRLPRADIVIACLPSTRETRGLLDERRLRSMKKTALLVNVGRGDLIPGDALVKVLEDGHLGGVALDVTDPEPLPKGHPLWKIDRVLLTPHIAGQSFGYSRETEQKVLNLCCQNLERYLEGRDLVNRVDLEKGYVTG